MTIGVAIIGGGIFAREEHAPAVDASKDLTLKAIYSRSLKSAKSLERDVDLYSEDSGEGKSYKDLLERKDIDAVIVVLPIKNQPEYIRAALAAGKHVLSEKPIAENLDDANELIKWYHANVDTKKVTWGVAENFRYLNSYDYAAEQVAKLGRVINFRLKMQAFVEPGSKYYETEWRKSPTHQGGFLLDGGVHFVAGIRLMLGKDYITKIACFSNQAQKHLPPVDTVDAAAKLASGATGSISVSFGTTQKGSEWTVACEKGSVTTSRGVVTTTIDGKEEKKEIEDEKTGVPPEIRKWGEGLVAGKQEARQTPEEALADLEVLQNLLRSGEADGKPIDCVHQNI